MVQDVIDRLVAGTYADPDGGPPLRVETRGVVIARSLAGMEADIVRPLALGRRLAVVSDPTTHAILGERVERALMSLGEVTSVVLPEHPHADDATVERVRAATASADALDAAQWQLAAHLETAGLVDPYRAGIAARHVQVRLQAALAPRMCHVSDQAMRQAAA